MSQTEPHNEFLELCAISASAPLTEGEQRRLQEHLADCPSCRAALQQYEAIVRHAIPAMAAEKTPANLEASSSWSEEEAKVALFERIAEEERKPNAPHDPPVAKAQDKHHRILSPVSAAAWRNVWALYAAGLLLFVALGVCAYEVGAHRGPGVGRIPLAKQEFQGQISLEEKLSDASHEREIARAEVQQRDKLIGDLRQQLIQLSARIDQMRGAQEQSESALRNAEAGKQELIQQRTEAEQKLTAAQSSAQALQTKLDSITAESSQDAKHMAALDAKISELNSLLHQRETALDQQQELLAHDRDIRDLMGARDLYVAEVYDVERTGETQKPYGRVFYTKGKSLIFYAYDLDRQPGIKSASTFQVWGQHGTDRQEALPLGIFYEDNSAKKRWVLKLDDPKVLAQVDAVFVTVEPNGGSRKPNSKPLLFAYLRVGPNHP